MIPLLLEHAQCCALKLQDLFVQLLSGKGDSLVSSLPDSCLCESIVISSLLACLTIDLSGGPVWNSFDGPLTVHLAYFCFDLLPSVDLPSQCLPYDA